MSNETTLQASYAQENPEADECNENVPPGVSAALGTSKLRVQTEDVVVYSSMLGEENSPLSDTCTFSTPAPTSGESGGKTKSRLSGFQSALTPILKYLNISTKRQSPEPLKCGFSTANCQKSTEGSGQKSNSSVPSGRLFSGTKSPVCLLDYEYLPEITLLDVTCDPTMQLTTNDSVLPEGTPATPKVCNAITRAEENNTGPSGFPKLVGTMTGTQAAVKTHNPSENKTAPASSRILERYLPEITLLDVSRDSELSPGGQISTMDITQDMSRALSEHSGQMVAETGGLDAVSNELSSTSVQSVKCVKENSSKISLESTQEITMGSVLEHGTYSSSKTSGENMEKPQTSTEDTFDTLPANITRDINSSSDMSAQCAHASTSAMDCNSKGVDLELHSEPTQTPDNVEATNKELMTSKVSKQSPKTAQCENNILPVVQASSLSTSSDFNTTAPTSCSENKTLDLPTFNVNSPEVESRDTDQARAVPTETSFVVNQNSSASKESSQCEVQNATFDRYSLQKPSSSTTLGEVVATTPNIQNNTFDCRPASQQNGTITLSEISSCDSQHNTLNKPPSPKVCNLTISLKNDNSDVHPPELPKHREATETLAKMVDNHNGTFEATPVLESVSGDGTCESKDHSQSGLPVPGGLSDPSNHHGVDAEHNKANSFNLDETLDLRVDSLITSTPMTNCKIFNLNTERETGKIQAAPKKLYGDGLSKPADQAPSNIVCDRKTFLTHTAAKSFWPPSKVASLLLEKKPGSTLQGRLEPVTSGLPAKRQRTQADALRNTASEETGGVGQTAVVSSSYNLRSAAAVSKLPSSGLQKPQVSGIPSAVQKAAPGLRPPSARINTQASSSTDKTCGPGPAGGPGPGATNLVSKISQGKKHPLTKAEALPVPKRKKTDALVPSSSTEASSSARETSNRAKNLKQPTTSQRSVPAKTQKNDMAVPASTAETLPSRDVPSRARSLKRPATSHRALPAKPQGQGCAKCSALEEQLKIKEEEIQRLKEELLKYRKQEDS